MRCAAHHFFNIVKKYKTFLRTANSFEEYSRGEKIEQEIDLTFQEAFSSCSAFNKNRTEEEIDSGLKMEFDEMESA